MDTATNLIAASEVNVVTHTDLGLGTRLVSATASVSRSQTELTTLVMLHSMVLGGHKANLTPRAANLTPETFPAPRLPAGTIN